MHKQKNGRKQCKEPNYPTLVGREKDTCVTEQADKKYDFIDEETLFQ
jgi:hypothetical protein